MPPILDIIIITCFGLLCYKIIFVLISIIFQIILYPLKVIFEWFLWLLLMVYVFGCKIYEWGDQTNNIHPSAFPLVVLTSAVIVAIIYF